MIFNKQQSYKFWFSDTRRYYDDRFNKHMVEIECWLKENKIKYYMEEESVELYNEIDIMAFKLRWQ